MATKLVLIPYLQRWDGNALNIRLLCLPRGSPLDPLVAGSSPSFATATFKFEVHILTDIDSLPAPGGPALTAITSAAPSRAEAPFQTLAVQFPIDPIPPRGPKPPGSKVKKHLPQTYQDAVGYAGANPSLCFTDDTYSCLMGQQTNRYQKLPPPKPKWAWGRVIAAVLRNSDIAVATAWYVLSIPSAFPCHRCSSTVATSISHWRTTVNPPDCCRWLEASKSMQPGSRH